MNRDTDAAWKYHNQTKHSVASLRAHQHYLDWEIKPWPFKVYPSIEPLPLPRELDPSPVPALSALAGMDIALGSQPRVPDVRALARVLHFSAGITRKKEYPGGGEYYFRAAACTGALYHIDVYVISEDLPGLAAGVYQFGPHNFALHRLRGGDHRGVLVEATGAEPSVRHAPILIALASTYWRNSWKYQSRAYRHCFWDSGTMLANLLAVASADGWPAHLVVGFVDDTVSALLGLDTDREGPLALVALGREPGEETVPHAPVPKVSHETLPLSSREVDYPAIRAAQAASSLQSADEVRAWRAATSPPTRNAPASGQLFPLRPLSGASRPGESIDRVIHRRGSTRQFATAPIQLAQLSTILQPARRDIAADYGESPSEIYLIVNSVEGLSAGTYTYHRAADTLELLRAGSFRREAGHLGLGQELPADASVNIYVLCDLEPVLARFGNRGYRVAQLDAAIIGGRLYLAAYALRLGATGLTFFDDDVIDFFSPHATGKSVMFLVAVGRGTKALAPLG